MPKKKNVSKVFKVWPDASATPSRVSIKWDAVRPDLELFKKIYELNKCEVNPEDFLTLNGDVSKYGWEHVVNFALYEKYNYFMAYLRNQLNDEIFQNLKNTQLKDFVYVYCTMLTLILRSEKPPEDEGEAEENTPRRQPPRNPLSLEQCLAEFLYKDICDCVEVVKEECQQQGYSLQFGIGNITNDMEGLNINN